MQLDTPTAWLRPPGSPLGSTTCSPADSPASPRTRPPPCSSSPDPSGEPPWGHASPSRRPRWPTVPCWPTTWRSSPRAAPPWRGARADALYHAAATASGLVLQAAEVVRAPEASAEARVRMEGAQQWLAELALAGLTQLDNASIVPIVATLEGLQALPELHSLSAVLTGLAHELLDHAPTSALSDPPLRRWADLWTRAMLLTLALPDRSATSTVSGSLIPLGADIRHHDHLLSVVVHGLLDAGDKRVVRVTLSAWKVDAVAGAEIWSLIDKLAPALVAALAEPATLEVSGATLAGGDLRWDGTVTKGGAVDPFATDLAVAILTPPPPTDRHPLQIAIPQVFSGCTVEDRVLDGLPVDLARVSPHSDYDPPEVDKSTDMVALLRFDDGWSLQPLAGRAGKKTFGPAEGIVKAAKIKKPALSILQERASKLLRA